MMVLCRLLAPLTAVSLGFGAPAFADSYRLVPGDRVSLTYTTQGTSDEMSVDIDGQLRVAGAGAVSVAGTTLDEAETSIVSIIAEDGVFLNPEVSLQVLEYAPFIVSGDVSSPGQYPYIPGMTIGGALALSGGSQVTGVSRFEVERARIENEGLMRGLNLEIAGAVVEIARFEALVNGDDTYAVSDALKARIPSVASVPLDLLQQAEAELFDTTRALIAENLQSWDSEIALIENQLALFEERITVQAGIIESTGQELEAARDLQSRGLQTAARLTAVQQRDADARARALELESVRIGAVQALADARRARSSFTRVRSEDWLNGLQTARLLLEGREIAYARRLEQQGVLTGNVAGSLMLSDLVEVSYRIISPRDGRSGDVASLETRILPGEMLVVTVAAGDAAQGQ